MSPGTSWSENVDSSVQFEREAAFQHCPVGILVVRDNRICQVNPRLEELLGYSAGELMGKHPCVLHEPGDCQLPLYGQCDLQREGGPSNRFEYPLKHRNGHTLWCKVNGNVCQLQGSQATVLSIVDVSREYGYRQKLLRAQREWKATVDASPDMIAILDKDLRLLRVNERVCQVTGQTREELIGQLCYQAFGRDQICQNCPQEKALQERLPQLARVEFGRPAGTHEVSCAPLSDEDGQLLGSIHIVHDLTPLLREQKQSLALKERLLQSQKLDSIAVLAAGVAHEFNNILQTISNRAEVAMLDRETDSGTSQSLQAIVSSVRRASTICDQLLTFSGQRSGSRKLLDPVSLMEQFYPLLGINAPPNIRFELDMAKDLGRVNADAAQLKQLLMNLVLNATEACETTGGLVQLKLGSQEIATTIGEDWVGEAPLPGRYVSLLVRDTGPGIPEDQLPRIFDPFYTTKFQGRGLGLAAVLGIVHSHGGAIQVQSTPREGSCFRVLLPMLAAEQQTPQKSRPQISENTSGLVILADDEEELTSTLRIGLQRRGYDVLCAADGQEALEMYAQHAESVRAVVLDLNMPGLSGIDVLHQLREQAPALPIVLSSGYDEREAAGELEENLTEFLHKPYLISKLCDTLSSMIAVH